MSEHAGRPMHEVLAIAMEVEAAHVGLTENPVGHVPMGVPKLAKLTAPIELPASQLSGTVPPSAAVPQVAAT